MIESLTLRGLLSYGWEPVTLPLRNLNLLIGTNGSGKTNLIDTLDVLRSTPVDLSVPIRNKGGAGAWLHKGPGGDGQASIEVVLTGTRVPLRYRLVLQFDDAGNLKLGSEVLETRDNHPADFPFQFFVAGEGRAATENQVNFKVFHETFPNPDALFGSYRWQELLFIPTSASALPYLRGQAQCPEVTHVARLFESIHLFQGWIFGPASPARGAQDAGLPGKVPIDNGHNLALVLHRLRQDGPAWTRVRDSLRSLYPQIDDVKTSQEGSVIKFFLLEQGLGAPVPPSRISDGTLRWLSLLCLLLDPQPPPLICLEEPEIGLHPDLIATLARLLRDAAQRTQLIITTHSDALVSEFTDTPEDVVVCERRQSATTLRRLDKAELEPWLEEFSLGHAWLRGAIGGKRW